MLRLLAFVLSSFLLFSPSLGEVVKKEESINRKVVSFTVTSNPTVSVTEISGNLTTTVTKPILSATTLSLKEDEERKIKIASAFLGTVFSLLALWGIVKNLLIAVQTLGREGISVKFLSQVITAVVLLIILLYSLNVLFSGLGVVNLESVF